MLEKLHKGEAYANRPAHCIPVGLSLDPDTALLLEQLASGKRARSRLVTWLLHAEVARREERARLGALVAAGEDDAP